MKHIMLDCCAMRRCVVSYIDTSGLRHSVEVQAESLYEAAVLALPTFREHECEPAENTKLEVEIRSTITHEVTLRRVRQWLQGSAKSPKEALLKQRLSGLL